MNLRCLFGRSPEVTLAPLAKYLEQFGWSKYRLVDEPGEKVGAIHTGWRSSEADPGYTLVIDPIVEKGCLCFRVLHLLHAPRGETSTARLLDLLIAISQFNYSMLLGRFAYDPSDGEIQFRVDMPIDGNSFTYEQFRHVLNVITSMVEGRVPMLKGILAGTKSLDEVVKEDGLGVGLFRRFLEELAAGKITGDARRQAEQVERVLTEV